MSRMKRRDFLKRSGLGIAGAGMSAILPSGIKKNLAGPFIRNNKYSERTIVLGIDGMDPRLMKRFIDQGALPTFKKLMERNPYSELKTTMPPQTPVAWSSFITGTDPGGHGIFDFIHRTPSTFVPYLSTSKTSESNRNLSLGKYSIPLGASKVELMRRGRPFWSYLEEQDIPALIYQIPANFPVQPSSSRELSSMGTPDILGGYGTSTLFAEVKPDLKEELSGGRVVVSKPINGKFEFKLEGPKNSFHISKEPVSANFTIFRDPNEANIKILVQDYELILRQGEWSDWISLKFPLLDPIVSLRGIVRILVKQVHPTLLLYLSPINIDPVSPALPICSPPEYSAELAEAIGRYYTIGFPADSKALSNSFLSDDEFFEQAKIVLDENLAAFEYEFSRFDDGLFFFYFSSIDQNTHMFWRNMDPTHPLYDPNASPQVKNALRYFYNQMDQVVAKALSKVDSRTTFIVLSDHGFVPFIREFNLSTWLVQEGFTHLSRKDKMEQMEFYDYVSWPKTSAYAMGLNGIYLNLIGREKFGSVPPDQSSKLKKSIIEKLKSVRDPVTGELACQGVYDSAEIFSPTYRELAPDILVGYASGYRISDGAALGKFPKEIFSNRLDKWSADHCLEPSLVPGILFTNRPLLKSDPAIWDLAPSILKGFGITPPSEMNGRVII